MSTADDRTSEAIPSVVLVKPGLSTQDLITLNEEIAGMARAGLPLDQGLAALAREMGSGRLKSVTETLAADLQAGRTLPEALQRQAGRVPPYYAALVTAGVRSGRVADVLATLTTYARTMADLRSAVLGALIYPAIVFALGITLVTAVAYVLVPAFEKIFADFKMRLPWLTEWALAIGRHPVINFMLPPALLVVFLVVVRFLLRLSGPGRRLWARWVYAIPVAGTLIRSARLAAFTDMLAILVDHGVPLPEAIRLAGAASPDPLTELTSQTIEQDLSRGLPLAAALRERNAMPEVIAWMAGLGERRGNLAATLHQVAELYRRQAELRANLLRTVLPPFFIVVTAVIILGVFFTAVFLPLLGLLEGLSGGGPRRGGGGFWWW
jgi:type II secretory pathway component PulF